MHNIIAVIFKNESEGFQAFSELSKLPVTDQAALLQLVLVKRENNAFNVCESYDPGIHTSDDMLAGGVIGSLIGILGGPLGVLLLGSYGALVGGTLDLVDAESDEMLIEKVAEKMVDGEVALIMLAEETDESVVNNQLGKFDVEIARFDAAVVAQEVEEAARVEEEMSRLARQELRKAKKAEFKDKVEARRSKLDANFKDFKAKFES